MPSKDLEYKVLDGCVVIKRAKELSPHEIVIPNQIDNDWVYRDLLVIKSSII